MSWLGRTVGAHQVRDAVYEVLQAWLPVALADVARQSGLDPTSIRPPASWTRAIDYRELPAQQSPNVVVASPQTSGRIRRAADQDDPARGNIDMTWLVNIAAVVRGQDFEDTSRVVGVYMAAISAVVAQQLPAHELIDSVTIDDDAEQYDVLATEQQRTIAGGLLRIDIGVDGARTGTRLYDTPPEDRLAEPEPLPTVEDADHGVS